MEILREALSKTSDSFANIVAVPRERLAELEQAEERDIANGPELAQLRAQLAEAVKALEYAEAGYDGRLQPTNNSPEAMVRNTLAGFRAAIDQAASHADKDA